jgi:Fe-S-cluster containining protein
MNKLPRVQFKRSELKPGEILCDHCTAKCCRYFSLPIDEPDTFEEFEYLRWYVQHDQATIFTEDDSWFVLVHTVCKHLRPDNRCGIYKTRPQICRDYTTDQCEYEDDYTFDRYFETPEQIAEYTDARFSDANTFRSPKPTGLPIID